ncbi:MAG: SRPBCC family protein [Candidatus Sericytochromatia bacterium]|nr:SRPBCC family protein [Candidatus Sericytochromatia bacterium]
MSIIRDMGLGAGLMFLWDGESGRRRRARVRDRLISTLSDTEDAIGKTARDVGNRLSGSVAEVKAQLLQQEQVDDGVLTARVRARLGRVVSHPHALTVEAANGRIIVRGPILADEATDAVAAVMAVRGVRGVDNQLDMHDSPGDVPGLQGEGRRMGRTAGTMPETRTPTSRMMTGLLGGLLTLSGMRRRGLIGTLLGAGGMALLYRAVSNQGLQQLIGLGTGHRAIDFHKTITIHAPVERVFALWSNPENFPRFMSHLQEVRRIDDRRHHWIAKGPAGVPAEWESTITRLEPNRIVAWQSAPGSLVDNEGILHFEAMGEGRTRVDIRLAYHPPAGAIGHAVATLFGADPKTAMDEDLIRLKSLLEDGKTTADGQRVTMDEIGVARTGEGIAQSARQGAQQATAQPAQTGAMTQPGGSTSGSPARSLLSQPQGAAGQGQGVSGQPHEAQTGQPQGQQTDPRPGQPQGSPGQPQGPQPGPRQGP